MVQIEEPRPNGVLANLLVAPFEDVLSPNGGEVLQVGTPHQITWGGDFTIKNGAVNNGIINRVDIYLSNETLVGDAQIATDVEASTSDPSITSSLTFLRRTPWARKQVEALDLGLGRRRTGR